jgi:hypothetical protein
MPEHTETTETSAHTESQPRPKIRFSFKDDPELLKARNNFIALNHFVIIEDPTHFDTLLQLAYVCGQAKAITGIKGGF